jgi:transposase InsO family protein
VKLLHVVGEHTREALAIEVARSIDGGHTIRVLDRIVASGRRPELLRSDNGPELTANALRDWCRFGGSGQAFIEPGSPWENPFVESFGSRVRDEVLSVEPRDALVRDIYSPRMSTSGTRARASACGMNGTSNGAVSVVDPLAPIGVPSGVQQR